MKADSHHSDDRVGQMLTRLRLAAGGGILSVSLFAILESIAAVLFAVHSGLTGDILSAVFGFVAAFIYFGRQSKP